MKINFLKRTCALTMAAAMAVSFAGCGKEKQSETQPKQSETQPDETQVQTEAPAEHEDSHSNHKKADERIETAKEAAKYLEHYGSIFAPDGSIYYVGELNGDYNANINEYLDQEGNLYINGRLKQKNVTDYALANNDFDICMLVGDQLLLKKDYKTDDAPWETVDYTMEMLRNNEATSMVPAEIFSESGLVWGLDEDGYPYIEGDAVSCLDPNHDGFPDPEWLYWTDLAVFDVSMGSPKDEPDYDNITAAGIQKDGTVLAYGPMAEDILSWGPLSYINLAEDWAVGLTMDGKIKAAGSLSKMSEMTDSISGLVGLTAESTHLRFEMKAIDQEGNLYWFAETPYLTGCKIMQDKIEIIEHLDNLGEKFLQLEKVTPDGKYMHIDPDTLEWTE